MATEFDIENHLAKIKIAVIIAIIAGLATSIFFLVIEKESYSSVYILPGSIIQNPSDNSVLYVYGVISSETQNTEYTLDTYIGKELVKSKKFSLNPGETLEERVKTPLPAEVNYPEKITLTLNMESRSESVYFWLKNETQFL